MSDLRKAAEMALEALEGDYRHAVRDDAIDALRAALAQPEKTNQCAETCARAKVCAICASTINETTPVAYQWLGASVIRKRIPKTAEISAWVPLYAHPPHRKSSSQEAMTRKPLTDEEIMDIVDVERARMLMNESKLCYRVARAAISAALAQPEHETVMVNGLTEAETNASASVMGFTPPQRKPLTEEEIAALSEQHIFASRLTKFVRAIERAHGIGSEE